VDITFLLEWVSFALRWVHAITAIAWIGSSFYFIALDLGLRKSVALPLGASGEEWQVHGGGFYHIRKYMIAPPELPEHLIWFKWESYSTWLSGFALLCAVYYGGAQFALIDGHVMDLTVPGAILISLAVLGGGWIVYDLLCKSPVGRDQTRLMIILYVLLVALAWGLSHVFSGRGAFLHLGALTATLMTANVFLIIIPNQVKVVAALKAGETPNPLYGAQAKQRSLHNNYLTLPVIFLMLSNHNPLAYATQYGWVIASLVFLMGVTIRHYFNSVHAGKEAPYWTWFATALLFGVVVWLSSSPKILSGGEKPFVPASVSHLIRADGFEDVALTVSGKCVMCHAEKPLWPGLASAPKGLVFESDEDIARAASQIYLFAGRSHAMPPSNLTGMEDAERQAIVDWYLKATAG
jgi:uncharacterized membrane protein